MVHVTSPIEAAIVHIDLATFYIEAVMFCIEVTKSYIVPAQSTLCM